MPAAVKTAEEILQMTDEELLAAHERGELGSVDGTDPEQREQEGGEEEQPAGDENEETPPVEASDEEQEEEEQEEQEEEEETEEGDEPIVVAGKSYTKAEYSALLAELESSERTVPLPTLMEERNRRKEEERLRRDAELRLARAEGAREAEERALQKAEEARIAAIPKYDFKAKRKEYHELIKLEEFEKAEALMEEIDNERDAQTKREIELVRATAAAEVKSQTTIIENRRVMDATASSLYVRYPFLNNESKDADATAIYAVLGMRDNLIARGESPVNALRKAMETVGDAELKKRGKAPGGKKNEAETKRRAEALRKAIKAAGKQPPRVGGNGTGNRIIGGKVTEKQIRNMTDEEFAAADKKGEIPDGRSPSQRMRA